MSGRFSDQGKVIITANSGTNYYHNGDIGIITRIFANEVQVGVLRPTDDGKLIRKEVLISNLTHKEYVYSVADGKLRKDLVAMYSDLPLKLAYALTIHRGQGQTYDAVNINPRCSLPGQLYVALSRVRDIKHMHLLYPIKPENLVAAPEVIEFYCKMELKAAGKLRKPLGRPKKYASGNKRIWVPTPLEKHIRKECDSVKALKMAVSPRYSSDRVQIRVPLELVDHVEEEIRNWKSQAK